MRGALLVPAASPSLFAAAGWAFRSGADYQLRHLSAAERMTVLDTTVIGEKWAAVGAALAAAACGLPLLSALLHARGMSKKALR